MHKYFTIFFCSILLLSCGQTNKQADVVTDDTSNLKEPLYPFPQYLLGQIAYVDTMPLAIEKIEKINGVTTDSSYMNKADFKAAMLALTTIDPNSKSLRKYYREVSFHDLSIPALTFSITTNKADLPLKQADILLNPDTQKVLHVVLNIIEEAGDSTNTKRILWNHNMKCQMMEYIEPATGKPYTRVTQYIWDKPF